MTRGAMIALGMILGLLPHPGRAQADGWQHDDIATVRRAADDGDKVAALELGRRYETGRDGAVRDRRAAMRWYRRAARDERSRSVVYSPPVGQERYGRIISTDSGLVRPGLAEAKQRMRVLQYGSADVAGAKHSDRIDK